MEEIMPKKGDTPTSTGDNDGATDTTFTQADVDRIVKDRLERERSKYADYDDLKKRAEAADTSKSEADKAQERLDKLEKDLAESNARVMRAEVAQSKKLTPALAKRLSGATREELEADADELLQAFKPASAGGDGENGEDKDKGDGGAQQPLGRPKEKLRPGAAPDTGDDKSGKELADEVWQRTHGGL